MFAAAVRSLRCWSSVWRLHVLDRRGCPWGLNMRRGSRSGRHRLLALLDCLLFVLEVLLWPLGVYLLTLLQSLRPLLILRYTLLLLHGLLLPL